MAWGRIFVIWLLVLVVAVGAGSQIAVHLGWLAQPSPVTVAARAGYPVRFELPKALPVEPGDPVLARSLDQAATADAAALAADDPVGEGQAEALAPTSLASASPSPRGSAGDLLGVEFDLSDPYAAGDSGATIEIRKRVRFNGADAGDANIRVSENSTLSMARDELARLFTRGGRGELAREIAGEDAGRYISFDDMRRNGIDVRYDPTLDRVLVSI